MNAWLTSALHSLLRLGPAAAVGAGLMTFALVLFASAVLPLRTEIARLQTAPASADNLAAAPSGGDAGARGLTQLERFTKYFPTLAEAPRSILKLHQIAAHHGLQLETGEYRLIDDKEGGMRRYQITLPLHGGYAQVRAFLAQVLDEIPAATLDEVAIKRDSVDQRTTETRVRLIMYLANER